MAKHASVPAEVPMHGTEQESRASPAARQHPFSRALGAVVGVGLLLLAGATADAGPIDANEGGGPHAESAPCTVSGGGCLNGRGGNGSHLQATFGGVAGRDLDIADPTHNVWQHVYRDGRTVLISFHSQNAHVVRCRPDPLGPCRPAVEVTRAEFEGTGTFILVAGGIETDGNFQASVVDVGTCVGAGRDVYSITIRRGLVIGQGEIVHEISGNLDCGNLRIDAPWRRIGNEAAPELSPVAVKGGRAVSVTVRSRPS